MLFATSDRDSYCFRSSRATSSLRSMSRKRFSSTSWLDKLQLQSNRLLKLSHCLIAVIANAQLQSHQQVRCLLACEFQPCPADSIHSDALQRVAVYMRELFGDAVQLPSLAGVDVATESGARSVIDRMAAAAFHRTTSQLSSSSNCYIDSSGESVEQTIAAMLNPASAASSPSVTDKRNLLDVGCGTGAMTVRIAKRLKLDRKSTRLNSSHT